jgi:hypothetical protein
MERIFYTGIGSRETPKPVLGFMTEIGMYFAKQGFVLRSGGSDGADKAFEEGCDLAKGIKEIYLPWKNFNNNDSIFYSPTKEAYAIAERYHPNWSACSDGGKALHARNTHQVLGANLQLPSLFVICWSLQTGGTTQAIRVAKSHNIPVINLFILKIKDIKMLLRKLESMIIRADYKDFAQKIREGYQYGW